MLTEIYIEALLIDKDLADQVWEAWDASDIKRYRCGVGVVAYSWRPLYPQKRPLS